MPPPVCPACSLWGMLQEYPHSEHRRILGPRCLRHQEALATRPAYSGLWRLLQNRRTALPHPAGHHDFDFVTDASGEGSPA
jgi:hypothetical protein